MDKIELLKRLEEMLKQYIEDEEVAEKLIKDIEPFRIKYILGELDRNKTKDYSSEDKEVIKDIYFYYC